MARVAVAEVTHLNNNNDDVNVRRYMAAVDVFRSQSQDITGNQMMVFLKIAQSRNGISQRDLAKEVQMADGSVSRICAVLSERGNRGTPGLGLISIERSTEDYRLTVQVLSAKGRRVYEQIKTAMRGR